MNKKMRDWLIIVVIFLIAWFSPVPEGLTWGSWHIFSVFIATIIGFILSRFRWALWPSSALQWPG